MKTIISASRRTDMPAFYLPWLMDCIQKGYADVITPRGINKRVDLTKDKVHSIVFWSKNFGHFLKHQKAFQDYHLYFNFTVNDSPFLEKHVPSLEERLKQMQALISLYGSDHILWRFDPVVFWDQGKENNLNSFEFLLKRMSKLGIKDCVFSFCTVYTSVVRRCRKQNFEIFNAPLPMKLEMAEQMARRAKDFGIQLLSCCQKEFAEIPNIKMSSCIDGHVLSKLKGEKCSLAKDHSQRENCHCTKSIDIGSYTLPCYHGCLYCYANPA